MPPQWRSAGLAALLVTSSLLAACGQKGALSLPKPPAGATSASASPVGAASAAPAR